MKTENCLLPSDQYASAGENYFLPLPWYGMMVTMEGWSPARLLGSLVLLLVLAAASPLQVQPTHALLTGETSLATENPPPETENRLHRELSHAIARVQPLLDRYGYPALFLAVLVEGVGLVAPGQTILIAAALVAAKGGLQITWVLLWAFTAAVLGNTLGYVVGRRGGRPLLHKLRVNEKHLQQFEGYFSRFGPGLILVARFFDGLRQLNGLVAGLVRMPWPEFTCWNILGAVFWTGVWGLGTYLFEKKIAPVHLTLRLVEPWIVALSLLGLLAVLLYVLWPKRKVNT
jgi:membrane protein DedA with SNARE-associated domain